jgi:hypothetical protein
MKCFKKVRVGGKKRKSFSSQLEEKKMKIVFADFSKKNITPERFHPIRKFSRRIIEFG